MLKEKILFQNLLLKTILFGFYFKKQQYFNTFCGFALSLIVLGFTYTPNFVGQFVSSPREKRKRDRRESRRDKRETGKKGGQGRKRNRDESEETEEIKTFSLFAYLLKG